LGRKHGGTAKSAGVRGNACGSCSPSRHKSTAYRPWPRLQDCRAAELREPRDVDVPLPRPVELARPSVVGGEDGCGAGDRAARGGARMPCDGRAGGGGALLQPPIDSESVGALFAVARTKT